MFFKSIFTCTREDFLCKHKKTNVAHKNVASEICLSLAGESAALQILGQYLPDVGFDARSSEIYDAKIHLTSMAAFLP